MVSEQDMQLFLNAVAQLDGKKPFSSLDELLNSFNLNYQKALWNENFVKASIWNLTQESLFSYDYKAFLLEVSPKLSSRYLVVALEDETRRDVIKEILLQYGPSQDTVRPLVGALANENIRDVVKEILLQYGPSQDTVRPLVGALGNPNRKDAAANILVNYGKAALWFIIEPSLGTRLYEPLTYVINEIRKAA